MGKGKILRLHPFSARSPKYLFIPKHARFQVCFFSSPKFSHTIRRKKIASGILTLEALSRLGRVEREPQKPMGGGGATAPTIHLLVGGVGCSVVGVVGLPHRGFQYSCSTLTWAKQRLYRAIQLGVDPPPFLFFRCANFLVNFLPDGVEGTSHAKCYGVRLPAPTTPFRVAQD